MKKLFRSKKTKTITVILLIIVFVITVIVSKLQHDYSFVWYSPHCIISMIWCSLIGVHIMQHWKVIKAFTRKKMILRNKITALTIVATILMAASILAFVFTPTFFSIHLHGIAGRLFILIIIIHTIQKWKRLGFINK